MARSDTDLAPARELERLRADPERAPQVIEEVLRYEPPVHFRTRKALGSITMAGETIPKGAPVILLFAAGNRDPERFSEPDRFDPDRADIQHFGFGGGLADAATALVRFGLRDLRPGGGPLDRPRPEPRWRPRRQPVLLRRQ